MSRQINQPINQVRLTNVAVVRMNKGGKRFEIACYRNKVMDYRKGLEQDLSEVLQTERVFTNVSKGQFAKHSDLQKVFGTKNEDDIIPIILQKGQLQVSDLERQAQLENTLAQIATWVANHCVHPQSQRPYTVTQIKHALGTNYQVQAHKPIKKQYLDCVKFLKGVIPIERAKMELALFYTADADADAQLETLVANEEHLKLSKKEIHNNSTTKYTLLADPSLYRTLDDLSKTLPQGSLEVLRQVVTQEGDVDLELELERKNQQQQEQQQQQSNQQSANAEQDDNSSSDEDERLAQQLQQRARIEDDDSEEAGAGKENHDGSDDSDSDSDGDGGNKHKISIPLPPQPVSRKSQKQQQKQSKKAKRRQRELEADREARRQADEARQDERARVESKIQPVVEANATKAAADDSSTSNLNAKACNTCGGSFPNAAAYRAHFKSDWHRFNQKLKLQGMPAVSEEEFNLCDAESFFGN